MPRTMPITILFGLLVLTVAGAAVVQVMTDADSSSRRMEPTP